ncbi:MULTISPECIES: hypothetical protein [unclassified Streptomyces]|uniref:hypothetical protein n=1 Tax=unclassified Streptomyces TaxID=2593676 RepID=UPI0008048E0F|nr:MULTISPECIES: hypothetical protein [unclassified Streptomyces]MYR73023.1 hypothetical protein [Streptomyces sp. SID4925]SBU95964.1 hypothetical protein YUMDRAFT_01637 [Streptomyces sp. OspMP-M45]
MSVQPIVISAALGPRVAAFTCRIDGRPAAVVNTRIRVNPVMRTQAAMALLCAGVDAAQTMGALDGVRS